MSLIAKETTSGTFTPVPNGMHLARCYRIVDLGTQKSEYKGQTKFQHKAMLQFEVHGEDESGAPLVTTKKEPLSISKNYTVSLGEMATLRHDLQAWRGKEFTADELRGFELKNVLGAWAMLNVAKATGNNGKEYTNIVGINPVPKQLKNSLPQGHNKLAMFLIDEPDMNLFDTFSDSLKEKIKNAPEWQESLHPYQAQTPQTNVAPSQGGFDDMDDDIPF